jgi:hypothetical protein
LFAIVCGGLQSLSIRKPLPTIANHCQRQQTIAQLT